MRRRRRLTFLTPLAATLVAICLVGGALLPLGRSDPRDIPLPISRAVERPSSPEPLRPAVRRSARHRAIARAATVSRNRRRGDDIAAAAGHDVTVETAPIVSEVGPSPLAQPLASRVTSEPLMFSALLAAVPPSTTDLPGPAAGASSHTALFHGMYLTLGLLQAGDVVTTRAALKAGASESNRLMAGVVDSPAQLIAIKATVTVGAVYLIERLRKRHPVKAAVTLAAINSGLTFVVMHNAQVTARLRERSALEFR